MCGECIDVVSRHGEAARALHELSALIADRVGDLKLWKWRGESRLELCQKPDVTAGTTTEAAEAKGLLNDAKVIPIHDDRVWSILIGEKRDIKGAWLRATFIASSNPC
jgi:hypothetical protein